ncbi:MAG TPA: hypothetical protein VNF29_15545 [Candidatus Binataceae bacterium]|nr:hypothetical protein [Candidatus Binataceae bacterium]
MKTRTRYVQIRVRAETRDELLRIKRKNGLPLWMSVARLLEIARDKLPGMEKEAT